MLTKIPQYLHRFSFGGRGGGLKDGVGGEGVGGGVVGEGGGEFVAPSSESERIIKLRVLTVGVSVQARLCSWVCSVIYGHRAILLGQLLPLLLLLARSALKDTPEEEEDEKDEEEEEGGIEESIRDN